MKKIFYLIMLALTIGVFSCTQPTQPAVETTADTTAVDTSCVDTTAVPEIPVTL